MNLQNMRWPVMVAVMATTLAVLFGAGYVVKSQTVEEPLKAVYAKSAVVETSAVQRQGDKYVITVKFKEVPDFASAYDELRLETEKVLKETPFTIKVEDQRNAKLEQSFRRMNLYVQEALATGQFAAMADRVEAEAAAAGLTARLAVDNEHLFVQMNDGGAYLYSVAERGVTPKVEKPRMEGGMGL
ncbi:MAG: hypothetical protein K0R39_2581 [Symbiobacteriaceae bacterium]|jgi:hypothetical protein|nr:hypothetical protein [Symbiobacteriaceae bacterium]